METTKFEPQLKFKPRLKLFKFGLGYIRFRGATRPQSRSSNVDKFEISLLFSSQWGGGQKVKMYFHLGKAFHLEGSRK